MADLIDRQMAIDAVSNCGICIQRIVDLPSIDAVNRQEAIDKIKKRLFETAFNNVGIKQNIDETLVDVAENRLENWFDDVPSVQPERKGHGCEYCCEHNDGRTTPIEKRGHAFIIGRYLQVRANRWIYSCTINFCPMCGRKLRGE